MEEAKPTKLNEQITETIKNMASFMGTQGEVKIEQNSSNIQVSVYTEEGARVLIGKNGQNLNALEHILRLIINKQNADFSTPISLDINDYKKSKAVLVLNTAKEVVERVRNTRRAEALIPMSAYERKLVHTELASCPDIITESVGEGAQRRIVIKPYLPI